MEWTDPRLIITTVGYTIAAIITLLMAGFALFKTKKRGLAILFALMCLSIAGFQISHVIGINIEDSELSRKIFMGNLSNIGMIIFIGHWLLLILDKKWKDYLPMIMLDIGAVGLFIFYVLNPQAFLETSIPKMYLPNYYEPGAYYWVMRMHFNIAAFYYFYELWKSFKESKNPIDKNRYKYIFTGLMVAFLIGSTALFLVYDIEFDPLWSMFFGLYAVPFLYAMVQYELMDIKIIARRALLYTLLIAAAASLLSLLNFANNWLVREVPDWPFWLIPLLSSTTLVASTLLVWEKLKEAEVLKYEFITIVTHKFRTPLTYIKWSLDNLIKEHPSLSQMKDLEQIRVANFKLTELTNILIGLTDAKEHQSFYARERVNLSELVKEVIAESKDKIFAKRLTLTVSGERDMHMIFGNPERIKAAARVLILNAITYTADGGKIKISVKEDAKNVSFEVTDTGIGFSDNEKPYLFSKFYRSDLARNTDTEGLGIGLFIVKEIAERHGGKVFAKSDGHNKGSIFGFSLPKA